MLINKKGSGNIGISGIAAMLTGTVVLPNLGFVSSSNISADGNFVESIDAFLAFLKRLLAHWKSKEEQNGEEIDKDSDLMEQKSDLDKAERQRMLARIGLQKNEMEKWREELGKQDKKMKEAKENLKKNEIDIKDLEARIKSNDEEETVAKNKARKDFSGPSFDFNALGEKLINVWKKNYGNFKNLNLSFHRESYLVSYFISDTSQKAYLVNIVRSHLRNIDEELSQLMKKRESILKGMRENNAKELLYLEKCLESKDTSGLQKLKTHFLNALDKNKKEKKFFISNIRNDDDLLSFISKYKEHLEKEKERIEKSKDMFDFDKTIREIEKEKDFIENNLLGDSGLKEDLFRYDDWLKKSIENNKALEKELEKIRLEFRNKEESLKSDLKKLEGKSSNFRDIVRGCENEKKYLEGKICELKKDLQLCIDGLSQLSPLDKSDKEFVASSLKNFGNIGAQV